MQRTTASTVVPGASDQVAASKTMKKVQCAQILEDHLYRDPLMDCCNLSSIMAGMTACANDPGVKVISSPVERK